MKPHVKIFLSTPAIEGVFGSGKWMLLNAIRKEGSLKKAAQKLGRGYRKAWGDIRVAEKGFGQPLVCMERGGATGGRASLTEFGKRLLAAWDKYHSEMLAASDKFFAACIQPILKRKSSK